MKSGARSIAAMALAFVILPAVHAQDAPNPNAGPKQDDRAASIAAPAVIGMVSPSVERPLSLRSPANLNSQSRSSPQTVSAIHRWGQGQDTPVAEWFLGYSFWRAMPTANDNRMAHLYGGSTSVAQNLNSWVGLTADFSEFGNSSLTLVGPSGDRTVGSNGTVLTYAFGPRFSYRRYERFTPFAQVLFGVAYASSVTITGCTGNPNCTPLASDNAFAELMGAGFDININHRIALRPLEADFLLTHFRDAFSAGGQTRGWQNNVRLSSGIVFRFGE